FIWELTVCDVGLHQVFIKRFFKIYRQVLPALRVSIILFRRTQALCRFSRCSTILRAFYRVTILGLMAQMLRWRISMLTAVMSCVRQVVWSQGSCLYAGILQERSLISSVLAFFSLC